MVKHSEAGKQPLFRFIQSEHPNETSQSEKISFQWRYSRDSSTLKTLQVKHGR